MGNLLFIILLYKCFIFSVCEHNDKWTARLIEIIAKGEVNSALSAELHVSCPFATNKSAKQLPSLLLRINSF